MSRLIDEYTRNKSPEDKKEVERRVREMAGTMSELSALMLVLEEMRQEGKKDGGIMRIGFKGGADMATVSGDTRAATAKSVSISPTGGVTTSRDKGPDPVDDRSSFEQTINQRNIVDRSKKPKKSGLEKIFDAGQEFNYLRNLAIGNFPGIGKQLLLNYGKRKLLDDQVMLDTEDDNMMLAGLTKTQKKMLEGPQKNLKNIMGISNEEILKNIEKFNDPNDPATIEDVEQFYQQAKEGGRIGLAEGTKKFMFNDVLREPMSELEKMSVGNPGTKEMYASEIREMLAQNRDEAKVKIPKKKKKQKPLKIDLEKIKKLIQKAKAREGAADGGIGYLLGE